MLSTMLETHAVHTAAPSLCSHEGLWAEYLHADEQLELDVLHALEELHIQMLPSRNDGEEVTFDICGIYEAMY